MIESMEVTEPDALRALAHPVRQRILMELAASGHGRAADLAGATGLPANSVSFHLRVLAKAGMVVEAPELARDKRDRVWTNAARSYSVKPGAGDASGMILQPALRWTADIFSHTNREDDPFHRQFMLNSLLLTKEQATEMAQDIAELMTRWAETSIAEAHGHPEVRSEPYQVLTALGPMDSTRGDDDAPTGSG